MADPRLSSASTAASLGGLKSRATVSLLQPTKRRRRRSQRLFGVLRSVFRSLPIVKMPRCIRLSLSGGPLLCLPDVASRPYHLPGDGGTPITGTLFGPRRGRVSLALQDSPCCLPTLVIELGLQTQVILREMGSGMLRIALECEKQPGAAASRRPLLEEPIWTMFCNGRKGGYGIRREATEDDLNVMESLHAMSMGDGVLHWKPYASHPYDSEIGDGGEGEIAYMRCKFEHAVRSRDSETLYMIGSDGDIGPDLTIFFVRI